jgi:hypothetical protein
MERKAEGAKLAKSFPLHSLMLFWRDGRSTLIGTALHERSRERRSNRCGWRGLDRVPRPTVETLSASPPRLSISPSHRALSRVMTPASFCSHISLSLLVATPKPRRARP